MYCGICVEVCPFDALFWSPEYEYSELRLADLLHDKDRLGEWMQTVPDFEAYEAGSEQKVQGPSTDAELIAWSPRTSSYYVSPRHGRRRRRRGDGAQRGAAARLIAVFAGVAAQFVLLAAEFVAVTQVLIYIGAIMVLMLFGIMLTRARSGATST